VREARYRALLRSVPDTIVAVFDRNLRLVLAEGGGVDADAPGLLPGTSLQELVPPERAAEFEAHAREALAGACTSLEYRDLAGHRSWAVELVPFRADPDAEISGVSWVARDVSANKTAEAHLAHQALHDPLTGLANRQLFMDRLAQALARLTRRHREIAVIFIDLDRLKVVNDSLGHAAGDEVLMHAARRMQRVIRPTDTLARWGGDEFVVVCEEIASHTEAERIVRRLAAALARPLVIEGQELTVTASMGIALTLDPYTDPGGLIRDADAAMYRAKDRGRATFEFFDSTMRLATGDRLRIENELQAALLRDEFELLYQPQVQMGDGRVIGGEALLRWRHPERGVLEPKRFIGLAEESGLIVPIGYWVIEQVCRDIASWPSELTASINLSPNQLADPKLVPRLTAILETAGIAPDRLWIEVTESALFTEAERATRTLHELRRLGFTIAIDDFGVGFSSLYHLRQLPDVDVLKLDRTFVSQLGFSDRDAAIAASVILLTNSLGMEALGEGIETEDQADYLRTMGCDFGQGFLFGAPQPVGEFLSLAEA
jgi:diguanylate cyclase (GGDEF)-like protein